MVLNINDLRVAFTFPARIMLTAVFHILLGVKRTAPFEMIKKPRKKVRDERTGKYSYPEETFDDDEEENDDEDSYEYVDKFRFKVDAEALRAAIVQKTNLKAKQQLSSSSSSSGNDLSGQRLGEDGDVSSDSDNRDIMFNQSLLDKIEAIIDDSGENTTYRLVLDIDDFAAMIDQTNTKKNKNDGSKNDGYGSDENDSDEDDSMYSSDGIYIDKKERAEKKKSLAYSDLKMAEAEAFIHRNLDATIKYNIVEAKKEVQKFDANRYFESNVNDIEESSVGNVLQYGDSEEDLDSETESYFNHNEGDILKKIENNKRNKKENEVSERNISNLAIARKNKKNNLKVKIKAKPRQYLADMTKDIILENIYGTAVIGIILTSSIFLFDWISTNVVLLLQSCLSSILKFLPFFQSKKSFWQRSAKPLVLSSILFSNLFVHILRKIKEENQFAGIGYKEGEQIKRKSSIFSDNFRFLKGMFSKIKIGR